MRFWFSRPATVSSDCLASLSPGTLLRSRSGDRYPGCLGIVGVWVRLGLPIPWASALWVGLAAAGALGLWNDRARLATDTVSYAGPLVLLSVLICAVYFVPGARNDAVLRQDGSFNWIYADTQYFHSIAADIKSGQAPPKDPGTATKELLYHFGPYAPAAAISRVTGLPLGDAFARVTRGASLWALVLSCFGLGSLLSLTATGSTFGAIMSVAGFFFYGSLLSLFSNEANGSSYVTGAILFQIPDVQVLADGGPFSHLILGHSMLHGLVAITAIMGVCLLPAARDALLSWRGIILLALPALAVPVNSVVALYCLGIVGILMFWPKLGNIRTLLLATLMLCIFLGAWKIMDYGHSPEAGQATIKAHMVWEWWTLVVGFTVGLGFRIVGFRWISRSLKDPLAVLVLASVVGLLLFSLLIHLDDTESIGFYTDERYGIYFLQSMLSIFAFSRLTAGFWRGAQRGQWVSQWLRIAKSGMALLIAAGVIIGIRSYATHVHTGIPSFGLKIVMCALLLFLLAGTSAFMKRNLRFSAIGSAILMGLLAVGFLG